MKKGYAFLVFILFTLVTSYFFAPEYTIFLEEKKAQDASTLRISEDLASFSFETIQEIKGMKFYAAPSLDLLDLIVQKLNAAKEKVYVNVYILTEKSIRSALIAAETRGIDVKVVLEKNVYMAPNLNNPAFDDLKQNGIDIVRSPSHLYALNHAKFMLIDDEVLLSTGNFSYTTFKSNRDFFLFSKDVLIYNTVLTLFLDIFSQLDTKVSSDAFLISPYSSRSKIEYLLQHAKNKLQIYMPYLDDKNEIQILSTLLEQGKRIEIITNNSDFDIDIGTLEEKGAIIKKSKKKIHAKSILVDDIYLYIGSINFSAASMDKNMELGLVFNNQNIIEEYQELFTNDFYK